MLALKLIYNYHQQLFLPREAQRLSGVNFYRFSETRSLIRNKIFQVVLKEGLQALAGTRGAQQLSVGAGAGADRGEKVTCPTNGTRTSR